MVDPSEVLRDVGWAQGHLIHGDLVAKILGANLDLMPVIDPMGAVLVLITQDCDIVKDSDDEPFLEWLVGQPIAEPDPLCLNGRNPRVFHCTWGMISLSFSVHNRLRTPKAVPVELDLAPSGRMPAPHIDQLRRWFSRRYLRAAFPDCFNRRLNANKKALEKWEKSQADKVSIILFQLDTDEELDLGADYHVRIILGYPVRPPEKVISAAERDLENLITVSGVGVEDIVSFEENDITLRQLRTYRRWDRDYRSLPGKEGVESPAPQFDHT